MGPDHRVSANLRSPLEFTLMHVRWCRDRQNGLFAGGERSGPPLPGLQFVASVAARPLWTAGGESSPGFAGLPFPMPSRVVHARVL